jgi:hypothetical protein
LESHDDDVMGNVVDVGMGIEDPHGRKCVDEFAFNNFLVAVEFEYVVDDELPIFLIFNEITNEKSVGV